MAELPDISQLDASQLLALREAVDAKLTELRAAVIEKAAALGLAVVEGDGKKPKKRRASTSKEHE